MGTLVETREAAVPRLLAGTRVKGEYRCAGCGYGVTVFRALPACPMCGAAKWEQVDWAPFSKTAAPTHFAG